MRVWAKILVTIKNKAISSIVWFMLSGGVLFLYNFGVDIINIPKNIKELRALHKNDSIKASEYIQDIEKLKKEGIRMYWQRKRDSTMLSKITIKLKIR